MSRTRWLAVAGVGALAVMALLIPGAASSFTASDTQYSGRVNNAPDNANVRVNRTGSSNNCQLPANTNFASVANATEKTMSGAIKVRAALIIGGTARSTVTITSYGFAGRQFFPAYSTKFACDSTTSVVRFTPLNASDQQAGTTDDVAVTFSDAYNVPTNG